MLRADRIRPAATLRDSADRVLSRFAPGSTLIRRDLIRFVGLVGEWQRAHNLVSASTLAEIWTRHIADSLQLLQHAPAFREWVDLGSGAGFPGLVVSIAAKGRVDQRFTLVESNLKKAAFLRAAIRETGANAAVVPERAEEHGPKLAGRADIISARAVAPLTALLGLAAPYVHPTTVLLLLKGQDFAHEHKDASKAWSYDMVASPSATDSRGRVLVVRNLMPKAQHS